MWLTVVIFLVWSFTQVNPYLDFDDDDADYTDSYPSINDDFFDTSNDKYNMVGRNRMRRFKATTTTEDTGLVRGVLQKLLTNRRDILLSYGLVSQSSFHDRVDRSSAANHTDSVTTSPVDRGDKDTESSNERAKTGNNENVYGDSGDKNTKSSDMSKNTGDDDNVYGENDDKDTTSIADGVKNGDDVNKNEKPGDMSYSTSEYYYEAKVSIDASSKAGDEPSSSGDDSIKFVDEFSQPGDESSNSEDGYMVIGKSERKSVDKTKRGVTANSNAPNAINDWLLMALNKIQPTRSSEIPVDMRFEPITTRSPLRAAAGEVELAVRKSNSRPAPPLGAPAGVLRQDVTPTETVETTSTSTATNPTKTTNTGTTTTKTTNTGRTTTNTTNTGTTTTKTTNTATTTSNTTSTATTTFSTSTQTELNVTEETEEPKLDIDALVNILKNLTADYETNLTDLFNETLQRYRVPTCATPTTTTVPTTVSTTEGYDYVTNSTGTIMGKCFVCGLEDEGIPRNAHCSDAFAGDFIPLVPVDYTARGHLSIFRKYCRFMDVPHYHYNATEARSIWGRWTGGCSVRWIDLSGVYTQRSCRNRYRALMGKHFLSKRMAKLEMALQHVQNGCIITPMASLVPLSRGVSLFARFHACVCTGSWCNPASRLRPSLPTRILLAIWTVRCCAL